MNSIVHSRTASIRLILVALLILTELPASGQVQNDQMGNSHLWSKRFGGTSDDRGLGVAVDNNANVFVTGEFLGTVDFGGGMMTSAGSVDIFLAKYSGADGSHLWSKRFGGTGGERSLAVAVDGNDNVVVTGLFQGTADFGGENLTSAGQNDIFLAKYSGVDGSLLWSRRFGGAGVDLGRGVTVDRSGNVVLIGGFQGAVDFGGGNLTSAGGNSDIFLAKYSGTNGSHLWSKRFGNTGNDSGYGVDVDSNGNVVITGIFQGTVDFGGGNLISAGSSDILVAKYSGANGSHLWSKHFGTPLSQESINDISVDSSGNIVVTGWFLRTVDFGGGGLTSNGDFWDIFVAMLSGADGSHLWSKHFGSGNEDLGYAVAVDSNGNVLITGFFWSMLDFDPMNGGEHVSAGTFDIFVAKFSGIDGSYLWSSRFGSANVDQSLDVAVDGNGNVVITGLFQGTVDFGGGALTSAGFPDIFVAKLAPPPDVKQGGVVNNSSYIPHPTPVAPGSIAAVFGTSLNDGSSVLFSTFGEDGKLVTNLGGTSVTIDGIPTPIFYSTPGQLGVQIPLELAGQTSATIQVKVRGQTSVTRTIFLDLFAPGIFTVNNQGTGAAAVLHEDGISPVTAQSPGRPGEVVILYATGLGAVTPPLVTGAPSTGNVTVETPTVLIDGVASEVLFSGAAPGFVGLNQVNVRIPQDARTASDIPVSLSVGGRQSNAVTIAVGP